MPVTAWAWVSAVLALGSLALAVHPFTTFPLSLRLLARRGRCPVPGGPAPASVAVCVCAYNEEAVIGARIDNLLAARRRVPGLEILVYVDAASDATAAILRGYGDRIRLVVSPDRLGKTHGMNRLVALTDAEVVVFSDANVTFAEDAIERLVAPFADAGIGCVCGHLRYVDGADGEASTAATGSLYWRLEEYIKALESATGSVMGADGSIFALRRALHRAPPPYLIDDMYVSLAVLCAGERVVRVADAVAYEAAVSRPAEEFRRKVRIACQAFNVNRALWPLLMRLPALDRYKYVSHKLLRWLSIYWLGCAGLFALLAVLLAAGPLACAGAAFAVSAAGLIVAHADRGAAGKLREVLAALLATGIGVWRSCRGETFQTWNPPASARAGAGALADAARA